MHIDVLIDMWALSAVDGPIIVYPVHTYITRRCSAYAPMPQRITFMIYGKWMAFHQPRPLI